MEKYKCLCIRNHTDTRIQEIKAAIKQNKDKRNETKEDLESTVYDIFSEMESTADYRNCFIEASAWCEELDMW